MEKPLSEKVKSEVAALYHKEGRNLFQTARTAAGGERVANDCVQDAFIAAALHWDKLACLDDERRLAWLRTVVKRRVIDNWRASRREAITMLPELMEWESERRPTTSPDVEGLVLTNEALHRLQEVLMEMHQTKKIQARVAWLMLREEWETKEVAEHLGIAESTVRVHLSKAKVELRAKLRDVIPFEPGDETRIRGT